MSAPCYMPIVVLCSLFKAKEAAVACLLRKITIPRRVLRLIMQIQRKRETEAPSNVEQDTPEADAWCPSCLTYVRDRRCSKWRKRTRSKFRGARELSVTSPKAENLLTYQTLTRQGDLLFTLQKPVQDCMTILTRH